MSFTISLMKSLLASSALMFAVAASAQEAAQNAKPAAEPLASALASEVLIKRLFAATRARKKIDGLVLQMEGLFEAGVWVRAERATLLPEQKQIIDKMLADISKQLQARAGWEVLEPELIEIYQKNFTQEEVLGLLAFYESPIGQVALDKLPRVLEANMILDRNSRSDECWASGCRLKNFLAWRAGRACI